MIGDTTGHMGGFDPGRRTVDRRAVLRDGAGILAVTLAMLVVRVVLHGAIDSWAQEWADRLTPPVLVAIVVGSATLWTIMAIRGCDTPLQRWTARFVLVDGMAWGAILIGIPGRFPLFTLFLIALIAWAVLGMVRAAIGRYVWAPRGPLLARLRIRWRRR